MVLIVVAIVLLALGHLNDKVRKAKMKKADADFKMACDKLKRYFPVAVGVLEESYETSKRVNHLRGVL